MKVSGFLRRFVCLLAVILLLLPAALAETVDLSRMSNDEIVALLGEVNAEIVSRGIQKTANLSKGAYIAGRDIPVGRYTFTCLATGTDWGNVTVYADGGDGDLLVWEVMSAPKQGEEPETVFLNLKEGDELKSGIPFSLTITSGVLFQ